jgi:fumarate reductase flavoprotein subunit
VDTWDLVVAGAGFAGLTAARAAAEKGLRVLVLEKAAVPGGSASISAGMIWAPEQYAPLRDYVPDGDPALQRLLCERFEEALDWLAACDLPLTGYDGVGGVGRGRAMAIGRSGDHGAFMQLMAQRATEAGATILYHAAITKAAPEDHAYQVTFAHGKANESVRARALLLATGGFQGSPDLLSRYLGADAIVSLRSVPECTGDGLMTALRLGAATGGAMDTFYGHTMPDVAVAASDMQPLTPYFARQCVFLNRNGRRFVDESAGRLEELNPQAGCRQPDGRYYIVFDSAIYRQHGINQNTFAAVPTLDRLAKWREIGAPIVEAPSIAALAERLAGRDGLPTDTIRRELEGYNAACEKADGQSLNPPRSRDMIPLREAPYFAVRCVAGITCTCGGIRIDDRCAVLDGDGGMIPGLFAAGVDAGGVFGRTYGGFLGWALVSGYVAGLSAAAAAKSQHG